MAKKAIRKGRSKTTSKFSWQEKGSHLLRDYLKKVGAGRGRILILNNFGDLLLEEGKGDRLDWTSIGSICASIKSAAQSLDQLLKTKSNTIQFGDGAKKGFWFEQLNSNWIVLGVNTPYREKGLKPVYSLLKSMSPTHLTPLQSREALDGLTEMSIESALSRKPQGMSAEEN